MAQAPGRAPRGAGVLGAAGQAGHSDGDPAAGQPHIYYLFAAPHTLDQKAPCWAQGGGRGELPPIRHGPPLRFPETRRLPVPPASRQRGALPSPAGAPGLGPGGCPPHGPSVAHGCTPSGKGLSAVTERRWRRVETPGRAAGRGLSSPSVFRAQRTPGLDK